MKKIIGMGFAIGSTLMGAAGNHALSQTFTSMTSGAIVRDGGASRSVNWVDVNNDGFTDLFVSNGLEAGEDNFLYINNGPDSNYTFRKVVGDPIVERSRKIRWKQLGRHRQ